jgi:cyclopropane fatty-acyl-phospholipid synthase-like methyltransferase
MMRLAPEMRVLEIGCGPGIALLRCAGAVTDGRIVGLDHSDTMIAQARARLSRAKLLERVDLVTGDVTRINTLGQTFDRVFSLNVVQFIEDKNSFFEAIHDVLAPGGMCFTTYQPRLADNASAALASQTRQIVDAMQAAGFATVKTSTFDADGNEAVCISGSRPKQPN